MSQEPLAEAYRAAHGFQAHVVAHFLQGAGIPAFVEGDSLGGLVGEVPAGWSTSPRVMVPACELKHALLLISTVEKCDNEPLIQETDWKIVSENSAEFPEAEGPGVNGA